MTFRIALVQPICHPPGSDERNVSDAVKAVARAAGEGAQFVCFPETYPGPWRMPASFDPTRAGRGGGKAQNSCCFGTISPVRPGGSDRAQSHLHGVSRRTRARALPPHASQWSMDLYGRDRVGIPVGSWQRFPRVRHGARQGRACDVQRVYMPEVCRALALRGAELIFMPAGKDKRKLWATWRALIWARAIENLALVVTTQNLFNHSERGLAMVAAPEEILFECTIAGTSIIDVSLDRVRYLRATRGRGRLFRALRRQAEVCSARNGSAPSFMTPSIPRPLQEAAE